MAIGYVSLASAVTAWALLALALVSGGLDPGASLGPLLKLATATAFCAAVLALGLGIAALIRARQRSAAALGLALSLLFSSSSPALASPSSGRCVMVSPQTA